MTKPISPKIIAFAFGVLVISFLAAFYAVAWQEPSSAPPAGNVDTPLNTGNTGQSKTGGLILNTGGAPIGLIVSDGNVGIGTQTPQAKFHVFTSGTDWDTKNLLVYNRGLASSGIDAVSLIGFNAGSDSALDLIKGAFGYDRNRMTYGRGDFVFYQNPVGDYSNVTESNAVMVIKNDGSVGIGTTVPTTYTGYTTLHINNPASGALLYLTKGLNGGRMLADDNGLGFDIVGTPLSYNVIRFKAGAISSPTDSHMVINSSGYVGIGTASPGNYKLNVNGDASVNSITIVGSGALPACDSSVRGKIYLLQSGVIGVEDGLYVCKKKTDGNYGWVSLASPTAIEACAKLSAQQQKIYIAVSSFPTQNVKRFFVTSNRYNGNLGGLTGADQICQTEANSKGYSGTWKVLLGDTTTKGIDRINDGVFVSPVVVMSEGTACYEVYASNRNQLIDGSSCSFTRNILLANFPTWAQNLKVLFAPDCVDCKDIDHYLNACKNWTYAGGALEYACFGNNVPSGGTVTVVETDQCTVWGYGSGQSMEGSFYCPGIMDPNRNPECGETAHLYCAEQ